MPTSPSPRSLAVASGQASADYVAVLAVVAVVLGGALASGVTLPLGHSVVDAIRHGICRVAGGVCSAHEARAAGLAPCLVHARGDQERLGVKLLVVRLGRDDSLLVERRSDGTAAVSFADGGRAGLGLGAGLRIPGGPRLAAGAGAGVQFTAGRTWEFASFAAAARFVRRWAREETLTGEARGLLHGACPFCPARRRPPAPSATYVEGGAFADFAADARLGAGPPRRWIGASQEADFGALMGRRSSGGRTTWYARLEAIPAMRLGAVVGGLEGEQRGDAVLEISTVGDRAVELRVRAAAAMRGRLDLLGPATSLRSLGLRLRGAAAGDPARATGLGIDAQVTLDLTDPRNHDAALGVLRMLEPGVSPLDWDDRVGALAARLDADGEVDVGVFRVAASERDVGAEAALGLQAGGGYRRTEEVRDLVRAWSLRRGGALQEREDCAGA